MDIIIIGASGATGLDLLHIALKDPTINRIRIFVRKDLGIKHDKLETHIIDFDSPKQWQHLVIGDTLFSCLGTTLKAAGSKQNQWKIDYDYQYNFAEIAKQNGIQTYILVSSIYANSKSSFYYLRLKGALEDAVLTLNFTKTIIFNPPSLIRKNSDRTGEKIGLKVLNLLNTIGLFKSRKAMDTKTLAQAMLNTAKQLKPGVHQFIGNKILEYK